MCVNKQLVKKREKTAAAAAQDMNGARRERDGRRHVAEELTDAADRCLIPIYQQGDSGTVLSVCCACAAAQLSSTLM